MALERISKKEKTYPFKYKPYFRTLHHHNKFCELSRWDISKFANKWQQFNVIGFYGVYFGSISRTNKIEHSNKLKDKTNAPKRPTGLKELMQTPFMSKKFQNFL